MKFAISDNDLWIVTSNDKPVKFVTEGDAIFEQGQATDNVDRTVDIPCRRKIRSSNRS